MFTTAVAVATLVALAPAAHAATPASGEVSESHLVADWSGTTVGQPMNNTSDTETHQLCIAPFCDSFTLNVKDAATALKVVLSAPGSASYVTVLVTKPDGTAELIDGNDTDTFQELVYEKPAVGNYMFDIWSNEIYGLDDGQYTGEATLCSATVKLADCFPPPPDEE